MNNEITSHDLISKDFTMKQAVKYLQHYLNTYDKQLNYEEYDVKIFIEDILYGLGVSLNKQDHEFANGFKLFKQKLFKYLEQQIHPKHKLRVWWIPQVPMKPFYIDINTIEEGVKILKILAHYDIFQFENNIKPDYANAGGLGQYSEDCDGEGNPGWEAWYDEETGIDDPEEYLEYLKEKGN